MYAPFCITLPSLFLGRRIVYNNKKHLTSFWHYLAQGRETRRDPNAKKKIDVYVLKPWNVLAFFTSIEMCPNKTPNTIN